MEIQTAFLESLVKDYKIFIDTSSLLEESAENFFQNIIPILEREHKSIIITKSVGLELEKLANDPAYCQQKYPNNPELNKTARIVCGNINWLKHANIIEYYGDGDDGDFADNVFLHVFTKKRMQYNLLLITQDRGLAGEIMNLGKDNAAVKGIKKIFVQRLDKDGSLKNIFSPAVETESEEIPRSECFAITKEIVQIEGKIQVSNVPRAGDYVTAIRNDSKKKFRLLEALGAGGEGTIYKTELNGFVAKIYKPEKITRLRYEKLKLMLTKNIDCEGICFPRATIYNQRNEFVGYLMETASGKDLGKSVFMPMLLKKYFPDWNKIDTVQLCITILRKLKYLHDRNIILGDINPYNILVVSPTEVYFVDTDSYQVEGFICPVGTPLFTPPELQKKTSYGLRTLGNENFAVATLLFMIMLPGKPPYAKQDGEGIVENIINGDFAYPFLRLKNGKVPTGQWRYCWSHLTYKIKEAFYQTFRYDGTRHAENERPSVRQWLWLFEGYLESLKSGKMTNWDEESILIFPTRWKKDKNRSYAKCKLCGREFEEKQLEQGICRDCLNAEEHYHCERCGADMVYTNRQKYIEQVERPKICRKHFKQCKLCGKISDDKQLVGGICCHCLNEGEHYRCTCCGREMIYTNHQKYIEKIPRPAICLDCCKHFQKCKLCDKFFDKKQLKEGICNRCLNKGEHYHCKRCGAEIFYTNRQKYIEKNPRPTICRKHFKTCKICGKEVDECFLKLGMCPTCIKSARRFKPEAKHDKNSAQDLLVKKLLNDIFKGK